ncbi:MAG: hypothetical protein ACREYF_19880 [Gammaproteobacteria bacterium]
MGDTAIDVESSYHAGVYSIGAGWGVQNFEALSSAAPDALFMKPSTLLKLDDLCGHGYFGESHALEIEPKLHAGSFLPCGGIPERYALGRYFPREDSRHATAKLSNLILELKNVDGPAPCFAKALSGFVARLDWTPDYIVSVPPKPSQQRNRFSALLEAAEKLLGDDTRVVPNGLRCVKEVEGYKSGLRPFEARSPRTIRGTAAVCLSWMMSSQPGRRLPSAPVSCWRRGPRKCVSLSWARISRSSHANCVVHVAVRWAFERTARPAPSSGGVRGTQTNAETPRTCSVGAFFLRVAPPLPLELSIV